jgi:diguanylate cyclase (GGDEF)-like protein/PAS domain S-box-containing protein
MEIETAVSDIESANVSVEPGTVAAIAPTLRAAVMLAHPTLAVAVTDRGNIVEFNAAWRKLFALPAALSADAATETLVATLFANAHGAVRFERLLQSRFVAGKSGSGTNAVIEHTLTRRDGTSFPAEIVVWLLDATGGDHPLRARTVWHVRDLTAERELHRDLRDLGDYHRELSLHQWDMTLVIDRKGRLSYVSPSIGSVLGHDVDALIGEPLGALLDPDEALATGHWLRSATTRRNRDAQDDEADAHRLRVLDKSGNMHILACRARNCFDVPSIAGMVVHARDITVMVAEEEKTRSARLRADSLRDCLFDLAVAAPTTARERVRLLLDTARERLGLQVVLYRPHDPEGAVVSSPALVDPLLPLLSVPAAIAWRAIDDVRAESGIDNSQRIQLELARVRSVVEIPVVVGGLASGWLAAAAALPRQWTDSDVDFLIGVSQLIATATATSSPRAEAVAEASTVDGLTGLPDRASARRWLEERVAGMDAGTTLTMISIDLDRFRDVNERHGHDAGDAVIARTARCLIDVIGDGGYIARTGGDAFVIVLTDAPPKVADETVASLLDRIGEPADADDDLPRVDASIGAVRLPADATDAASLWLYSELAMREAKSRGRGQSFFFNQRLAEDVRVRRTLDIEAANALARNEFTLFYQPQIAMATGKIIGLEALLRWQHPTRGLVLPKVFMETAIEHGLIDAITKWVLGQVCEQITAWRRAGDVPEVPVAVNVAANQFHDRRLPAQVAAALLRSGLPARLLVLELSEQMLIDDDTETQRVVKELDRLGVRTSVGGFALGHGALEQLRQLRVSQIKLDRRFVETLPTDEASAIVVGTMIEVARKLKCQVVAEGVETREQFDQLRALGCEVGQGFFFGAPLSPEEIHAFVENNQNNPIR